MKMDEYVCELLEGQVQKSMKPCKPFHSRRKSLHQSGLGSCVSAAAHKEAQTEENEMAEESRTLRDKVHFTSKWPTGALPSHMTERSCANANVSVPLNVLVIQGQKWHF